MDPCRFPDNVSSECADPAWFWASEIPAWRPRGAKTSREPTVLKHQYLLLQYPWLPIVRPLSVLCGNILAAFCTNKESPDECLKSSSSTAECKFQIATENIPEQLSQFDNSYTFNKINHIFKPF